MMRRMSSPMSARILDKACKFGRTLPPGGSVDVKEGWKSLSEVGSVGVGDLRRSFLYIL